MYSPHIHLLLNHIPTVGLVVAVGLALLALIRNSPILKQASLEALFVVSLLTLPAYLSGYSAKIWLEKYGGVSGPLIQAHMDAALFSFAFMQVTGVVAWLALWQSRRRSGS